MYWFAYLTNGRVAWPIGQAELAERYLFGYYIAPVGWMVLEKLTGRWKEERDFGSLRRVKRGKPAG